MMEYEQLGGTMCPSNFLVHLNHVYLQQDSETRPQTSDIENIIS